MTKMPHCGNFEMKKLLVIRLPHNDKRGKK